MKIYRFICLILFFVFLTGFAWPYYFLPVVTKKNPRKFFDLDKNGSLNIYELALLDTHKRFGWKMADSKKKRAFDFNQDHMLEPFEWEQYKNRKKGAAVSRVNSVPRQ